MRLSLALLAAGLSGCAGRPGAADPIRPLHVVVVTLDTLSARHLSQSGNRRINTPAFGRVAAEGVLLEATSTHVFAAATFLLVSLDVRFAIMMA